MAHAALRKQLTIAWEGRDPDLPLRSSYELLVLASIIERETALAAERPLIAGVFVRRLQRGMLLQTDPSVIYGLGTQLRWQSHPAPPRNGYAMEYLYTARSAAHPDRSGRC